MTKELIADECHHMTKEPAADEDHRAHRKSKLMTNGEAQPRDQETSESTQAKTNNRLKSKRSEAKRTAENYKKDKAHVAVMPNQSGHGDPRGWQKVPKLHRGLLPEMLGPPD